MNGLRRQLETMRKAIANDAESKVKDRIKRNMVSYSTAASMSGGVYNTASLRRDHFAKLIFEAIKVVRGTEYNSDGSWTTSGMEDAFAQYVKISKSGDGSRIEITVTGKLKELEEGKTNWKWFQKIWHDDKLGFRFIVKRKDPKLFNDINKVIDNPPQTTNKRPYVGIAVNNVSKHIHDEIDKTLERMEVQL